MMRYQLRTAASADWAAVQALLTASQLATTAIYNQGITDQSTFETELRTEEERRQSLEGVWTDTQMMELLL